MGYRLEISEVKRFSACGGKLFGYTSEKELKSWRWLLKNNYIDGDECWACGYNPRIVLDAGEFKEFMSMYLIDWKEHKGIDLVDEELQQLIETNNHKLLEWF